MKAFSAVTCYQHVQYVGICICVFQTKKNRQRHGRLCSGLDLFQLTHQVSALAGALSMNATCCAQLVICLKIQLSPSLLRCTLKEDQGESVVMR